MSPSRKRSPARAWPGTRSVTSGPGARPALAAQVSQASERGAVTIFVAVAAVGLLAMAGLVVDGAAKVRAVQRADRVASEAARAAGQAVDLTAAMGGAGLRVDRRAALRAAQSYLDAAGVDGEASVRHDGATLVVTTRTSEPTAFLGLIGVPRITVTGRAEAHLTNDREGRP